MKLLICALQGEEKPFFVEVDETKHVCTMEQAIIRSGSHFFKDFQPVRMTLYCAKLPGSNGWLESTDSAGRAALEAAIEEKDELGNAKVNSIDPTARIGDVFFRGNPLTVGFIHVLVMVRDCNEEPPSKRRKKQRDLAGMLPDDSSFARTDDSKYSWVATLKALDGQIECHRIKWKDHRNPVIPLVLMNEVFAHFDVNRRSITLNESDKSFAKKLCDELSYPFEKEDQLIMTARKLFSEYLLERNPVHDFIANMQRNFYREGFLLFDDFLLLNLICNPGDRDPTMETVEHYLKLLPGTIEMKFPCFVLEICGKQLGVSGILNIGNDMVMCDPLTPDCPLILSDNEEMLLSLARVCASLKAAVKELMIIMLFPPTSPAGMIDQRQFPFKNTLKVGDVHTPFEYLKRIRNLAFEARIQATGAHVIVKFTRRYDKEAHGHFADAGVAPKLLHFEALVSGWKFIVMEKLETELMAKSVLQAGVGEQRPQNVLGEKTFAHGDLIQAANLMWDLGSAFEGIQR